MAILVWDDDGNKIFEAGNKQLTLYNKGNDGNYTTGVAWNGLINFTVSNSGGDETALWADDIKYGSLRANEECGGTIECYQTPTEFYKCDGVKELTPGVYIGQQSREPFGLACKTTLGNDAKGLEYGYKIHLIYGATASPSERSYQTINDSPDANTLSYEYTCTPENCTGYKAVAHIEINSTDFTTEAQKAALTAFEGVIWGTENTDARLPKPDEVKTLLTVA